MTAIIFRRFAYSISIAALVGFTSLFTGQTRFAGTSESALAASDPVIAAAGDIACDPTNRSFNNGNGTSGSCRQKSTSDLLVNAGFSAVLPLGDNQYYCGGFQGYMQSYHLSWGRVKSITRPVVGNHEYLTAGGTDCTTANAGAAGYFNYFGSAAGNSGQGYYSYDIGAWHLIALNSNCGDAGGCSSTSPQGKWLAADLAAHSNFCTLAYWHIPLFSSGGRASSNTQSIWQTLYNNDVDVVLNGHDHIYERFAPQTPNGTLDTARGIREFIIGSGGANHTSLATIFANSEIRNVDTFGILKLTLHPTSYDWQFVPEAGKSFTDTGTGNCHGSAPGGTPLPVTAVSLTPTRTPSPTAAGNLFAFSPLADAYIDQTTAGTNFGSAATLQTDNSPVKHFLLRFNVTGINNLQIRSAKLRLYNVDASGRGGNVYRVNDNTWQESTVTWNNAPAADTTLLASLGAVSVNTWYEIDLTSLVTSAGTYNLRIVSTSSDGADYSSREGANPPQLVIETQSGPTPSSTNTATASHTATRTLTSTTTATSTAAPSPTLTRTLTATATLEPSPTLTSTSTWIPTSSSTATFTLTNVPAPTDTATLTLTSTPPATGPATSTREPATEPSPAESATPSDMETFTPTALVSETSPSVLTDTPTTAPSPSQTESLSPTGTGTPTIEPSLSPTTMVLPSATATVTAIPSPSWTMTSTASPTSTVTRTPTPTITNTPAPLTFVFAPAGDSYVNEGSPATNYGAVTQFRVDGSPIVRTYMRFNVQGLSGTITRVTLRVFANSSSNSGYTANRVSDNTWTESAINYNNAPAVGGAVGSSAGFSGGLWTTIDLTSLVAGNGTINLALTTSSSTAISLASRESGANTPQLIVETIH